MAQVTEDRQLREQIDDYLDYLVNSWQGVPRLAADWEEWDEDSRLVFDVNWAIPEDRLLQLRGWAEQGLLSASQRARYEMLEAQVAEYRPLLDRMLAE